MVWILYGDSGSLTARLDSSDDSFGSILLSLSSDKSKVGSITAILDSSVPTFTTPRQDATLLDSGALQGAAFFDSADDSLGYGTFSITGAVIIGNVDSNSTVVPSSLLDSGNTVPSMTDRFVPDEEEEAVAAGPTQIWIG